MSVKTALPITSLKRKTPSPEAWPKPALSATKTRVSCLTYPMCAGSLANSGRSIGIAALFAGTWGAASLITRGMNKNRALPWSMLSRKRTQQGALQLGAFWSLQYVVPLGLISAASYYPELEYNAGRRFLNAACVVGTGGIMYQSLGAQQALRRAKFSRGPFWAGRLPTLAAGAYVAFFAAAGLLSLHFVFEWKDATEQDVGSLHSDKTGTVAAVDHT